MMTDLELMPSVADAERALAAARAALDSARIAQANEAQRRLSAALARMSEALQRANETRPDAERDPEVMRLREAALGFIPEIHRLSQARHLGLHPETQARLFDGKEIVRLDARIEALSAQARAAWTVYSATFTRRFNELTSAWEARQAKAKADAIQTRQDVEAAEAACRALGRQT